MAKTSDSPTKPIPLLTKGLCIFVLCFSVLSSAMAGTTYTFTNADATGREGPTQTQVNTAYAGTTLASQVTINTQGIQEWTVPATGSYRIEAFGASGGDSGSNGSGNGGKGAAMRGNFSLQSGQVIRLIVGQQGLSAPYEAGGGGGTFVFFNVNDANPILAAGGGGGGGKSTNGLDAVDSTAGTAGQGSGAGSAGAPGNGGQKNSSSQYSGAAGSGWLTDGEDGIDARNATYMTASGGKAPRNGSIGGNNNTSDDPFGGFGGGGAGRGNHYAGAGGGGGYTGGGVGTQPTGGGGGGGSYNSGTDQDNTAGFNTGHGRVIITSLTPIPFELNSTTTLSISENQSAGTAAGEIVATASNANFTFDLSAHTSQDQSADTPGAIAISFFVNGAWTSTESFFTGADKGEVKTKTFTTAAKPTKLKFLPDSNNNGWGYWKVVLAGKTILEDQNGSAGSPIGSVPYWVDGDGTGGAPTFQELALPSPTYVFSLVDGEGSSGNTLFTLNSNGILKTSAILDYEANASHSIRVRATDELNASVEKSFDVNVTDDTGDNSTSVTYTFTNAGVTGREGPTQSQIDAHYSGTNLASAVTINTRGIQEWTVPASGLYRIEARGAMGGGTNGGKGAVLAGDFILNGNEVIKVIVGQTGTVTNQGSGSSYGAGGGGGSYVYRNAQSTLIIAAGGGGQAQNSTGGVGSATQATTNSTGTQGNGVGGTGGNGGGGGVDVGNYSTGGGGGGWLSNGSNGLEIRNAPGMGGLSPANGSIGGEFTHTSSSFHSGHGGDGGFGGGGGMSDNTGAGGGGGGYNGGGGGNNYVSGKWGGGGGGGSYNSGTEQNNTAGANTGHGKVIITFLSGSSSFHTDSGLVAWYPLDGNGTDQSATANHATVHGATPTADRLGVAGKALLFDGSDDYLEAPFNQAVSSHAFSYSIWAKPTSTTNGYGSPITFRADGRGFNLYKRPENTWSHWTGNGSWQKFHAQAISLNWTALAFTHDGTTGKCYQNGVLVASSNKSYLPNLSSTLKIGTGTGNSGLAYFFKGAIDEARIWNRVLSSDEIASLYSMEKPVNSAPTDLNSTAPLAFSENLPAGSVIGEFNATDPDANATLSFSLLDGNASLFSLEANGTLRTLATLDYETDQHSHLVRVRVTDEHNASLDGNFTIALLNQVEDLDGDGTEDHYDSDDDGDGFSDSVETAYGSDPRDPNSVANATPTALVLNDSNVSENQPAGTVIGDFNATDSDAQATLSFSLLSGANLFSLDANGTLRTLHFLDFETNATSYAISVRVTDQHNASLDGNFTISLLNQVEDLDGDGIEDHYDADDDGDGFPDATEIGYGSNPRDPHSVANAAPAALVLNDSNFSENQPAGTVVGDFNATDPDVNATLSFSLLSGANLFSLDANGTLRTLHVLDFETNATSYAISVRVTDEHNTSLDGNFTIALLDDQSDNPSPENNATAQVLPESNQTSVENNSSTPAWWETDADSGNGWRASPWLGSFRPYSNGWIYHLGLGWAYAQPDELGGLWLWMPNEQWVWSAPHCWPHMWKHGSSNWLYFVKEHEGKPALYDYSTESFRWK